MVEREYSNLEKAKIVMVSRHPFFATLLLSMPLIEMVTEEEKAGCPTFGVNGTVIKYNPDFAATLSVEMLTGVLAHEVMHIALLHPFRLDGRIPLIWNFAADFAINLLLIKCGFVLPEGHLYDVKYKGMSSEEIYRDLMQNTVSYQLPEGYGGSLAGDLQEPEGGISDKALAEIKAKILVDKAVAIAKMTGTLPSELEKVIGDAMAGESNWKEELRRFMTEPLKDDQSWNRQQRRFIAQDMYLPALYSTGLGVVGIILDSSGSVFNRASEFLAEITSICEDCKPKTIYVVQVDAEVQQVDVYEPGDPITAKVRGGGGTDLRTGFDWFTAEGIEPSVTVVFTDLETPFPEGKNIPSYPVIWAATEKHPVPFGDVLYL